MRSSLSLTLLAQCRTDLSFLSGGRSPQAQPSRGLSGGERKQSQTQSLSRHLFSILRKQLTILIQPKASSMVFRLHRMIA